MARALTYRKRHRLTKDDEYRAVFEAKARKSRGPMTVYASCNTIGAHRLGLSIGKRAGRATTRTRIKRLIREAFRHERDSIPLGPNGCGVDLVVTVRAHEPMTLEQWRAGFLEAAAAAVKVLERRAQRDQTKESSNPNAQDNGS